MSELTYSPYSSGYSSVCGVVWGTFLSSESQPISSLAQLPSGLNPYNVNRTKMWWNGIPVHGLVKASTIQWCKLYPSSDGSNGSAIALSTEELAAITDPNGYVKIVAYEYRGTGTTFLWANPIINLNSSTSYLRVRGDYTSGNIANNISQIRQQYCTDWVSDAIYYP